MPEIIKPSDTVFVLNFQKKKKNGGGVSGYLMHSVIPLEMMVSLNVGSIFVFFVAKSLQIFENHKNGSTGQLSSITVFLQFAGTAGKIYWQLYMTYFFLTHPQVHINEVFDFSIENLFFFFFDALF